MWNRVKYTHFLGNKTVSHWSEPYMNQTILLPPERRVYQAQVYNETRIAQPTYYVEIRKWLGMKGNVIRYVLARKKTKNKYNNLKYQVEIGLVWVPTGYKSDGD
jgi:hypothetical protein